MQKSRTNIRGREATEAIQEHHKMHSIYFGPCKFVNNTMKMLCADSVPLNLVYIWFSTARYVLKCGKIKIDDC